MPGQVQAEWAAAAAPWSASGASSSPWSRRRRSPSSCPPPRAPHGTSFPTGQGDTCHGTQRRPHELHSRDSATRPPRRAHRSRLVEEEEEIAAPHADLAPGPRAAGRPEPGRAPGPQVPHHTASRPRAATAARGSPERDRSRGRREGMRGPAGANTRGAGWCRLSGKNGSPELTLKDTVLAVTPNH